MPILAAPGDTWGIPGPVFLSGYLLAAVVIVVGTLVHRLSALAGPPVGHVGHLGPQQVAYLNGGQQLAIWASVGALRSYGAIGVRPDRRLTTGGPLPAGITPLDQAIHFAAGRNATTRELARDEWVGRALDQLRTSLEQHGLALAPARRAALRLGAFLLTALLLVGMARIVAGLANDRPVGWLVLSQLPLIVVAVLLHRVPWRTRAATRTLRDLRRRHTYLAPASAPAYATYGAAGAAMGVALFGTASLYAMDPGFAAEAEIRRQAIGGGSSGGSSCGGGGSCSGGSDGGGGGGGCGGGGCGG
ncbi:TIGR04222 domain-containing membrane protein [Micromonospora sp. C31]|uniref:TIGR04222 domain-containing membrane protein n=1 Tax=Micromonospora sp. C31 TaxID=2824876 RepID=UPI001B39C5F5|nr:TIGR04222 domain-containing membrane protein [Micromonospora sp. C31]MBQ1073426.1 TIGR04222 domain-containing membrane protein [Micromonospora sp. C31]